MQILKSISEISQRDKKDFLLIGGHAINFYGLSRMTGDIDLLVRLSDKSWWKDILKNYECIQDDTRFSRFKPETLENWPIDLMYVDDQTFTKLINESIKTKFNDANVQVISARHLAILKIHALKHYQEHRFSKDNDLIWLLVNKKTNLDDSSLKELCLKYADIKLYDKIKSELKESL